MLKTIAPILLNQYFPEEILEAILTDNEDQFETDGWQGFADVCESPYNLEL